MDLFENQKTKFFRNIKLLLPVLFLAGVCLLFLFGVSRTSDQTLQKEQATLTKALQNGAVHAYALTGCYPESLDDLLTEYHISYDREKFVVEYVPNGSNLLPMIAVFPLENGKGGRQ